MPIGAAANELMTSISHASTPIARSRRERANGRSEKVMGRAYPYVLTPSTLEAGSDDSRLAEAHMQRDLVASFQAGRCRRREVHFQGHTLGGHIDNPGTGIRGSYGRRHLVHAHHVVVHTLHVGVHGTHFVHAARGRAVLGHGEATDGQSERQRTKRRK